MVPGSIPGLLANNKKKNMCLDLKSAYTMPRIAFKDIKCYKKIIINSDGDLLTPFRYAKIKIGEQYRSRLRKYSLGIGAQIEDGLHSVASVESARNIDFYYSSEEKEVIVECIIPKFSIYYKGMFNDFIAYASNKLKYIEIVK